MADDTIVPTENDFNLARRIIEDSFHLFTRTKKSEVDDGVNAFLEQQIENKAYTMAEQRQLLNALNEALNIG